jgi:hypothetical protein
MNHNAHDLIITNNIFYNNLAQVLIWHHGTSAPVKNITFKNNIAFSKTAKQDAARFYATDGSNDIAGFGTFDHNYYCRPIDDNTTIAVWNPSYYKFVTLTGWKSLYNKDPNSKKTIGTISDTSHINFQYNATASNKTITLSTSYLRLDGTSVTGSLTLPPYSSVILLKSSSVTKALSTSAVSAANTFGDLESKEDLSIKAQPNPSAIYFDIAIKSKSNAPATIKVTDVSGKLVEIKANINSNSISRIGSAYKPGMYFIEVMQGATRELVKVIKQ